VSGGICGDYKEVSKEDGVEKTLIRGGLVIDGTGSPPIEKGVILIEGQHIIGVGKEEELREKADVHVLDCSDQTLLPGLIDCHNHLSAELTDEDWLSKVNASDADQTLSAITNMTADLRTGVTTLRCLGDKNFIDVACKKAVNSGRIAGPSLLVATRSIRSTHGHGILASPFDGLEQVRAAVRENIKAGADVIKILTTATVRGSGEIHSDYSREEILVSVEEAHRAGIRVTAHCIGGIAFQWCLEAGMDSIEHGYFLSNREIDLLAKSGRWLVLTPSPFFMEDRLRVLPPELASAFRRGREEAAERMAAAIKGGVAFAVGSDAIHGRLAQEIEYLVELGASEDQAIIAATRDAAKVCGLEGSIGSLEPGKVADIIGVKGNPLKDIRALRKIEVVISKGKLYYQTGKEYP
jgi:imidazolonepropionase-like amidohydrolase